MPYNVFISYSTKDIPNVDAVKASLELPDVHCFVSEYSVAPAAQLAATIRNAIQNCDLFVVIWSKHAAASEWVPQEIGIANGCKKPILPFMLEPGLHLPGFIKDVRYVAAYQHSEQAMYQLRETVLKNSLMKQNQAQIAALAIGGILLLLLLKS